ncbi:thiamine pyrophosphate-binding protein [Allorhodopirellula heiligendammensis]|uniref:Indole-3-pyruvate decarboxylase n=1 Tax=Allorhodopirellula heiligendammensis TaxID=2714739 RepID=A0A5C6BGZ7_9BACT|nr:thiamine pyrophosphate-binding protein [Allorhodopirellula heiligendammensis]TWU09724.1 Indole-3-pyruvate decarboxylase [Allorhodopirellula heiligendammensis]
MITVAEYLSRRLKQLGVDTLFSIPGNYTAEFLLAADREGIECVGTTNELEAGYAADAYARYRGIGVCSATYGVGSHSLFNAISGAYVEFCPVVLVNGSPPPVKFENLRNRGILFAHAIDPIRTDATIFAQVTVAATVVDDPFGAPTEIDRVLVECIRQSRPVYIEVLQEIWSAECRDPQGELDVAWPANPLHGAASQAVADAIGEKVRQAKCPVLWGGELLQRRGLVPYFDALVCQTGFPYTTTLMGKGLIPETKYPDQFIGVYDSKFAPSSVRDVVENSDCLIALGTIMSDFYADIVISSHDRLVLASDDATRVGPALYPNAGLANLMPRLLEVLAPKQETFVLEGLEALVENRKQRISFASSAVERASSESTPVTYSNFFDRLADSLDENSTLLVDTSLALFPSAEVPIRRTNGFVAQTAWLSIGYTCGATLGVATAEPASRQITVVGDGGFQMIPQSFSTLVRQGSRAIVFVLDNGTYGIEQYLIDMQILPPDERFFHNNLPEASFFDVLPRWNYAKLGKAFGGRGLNIKSLEELDSFLSEPGETPILVGVKIDQHDLPPEIEATIEREPTLESTLSETRDHKNRQVPIRLEGFN